MHFNIGDKEIFMQSLNEYYNTDCSIDIMNISIDSRYISENDIFVAIKGEKTNGHLYVDEAISDGASIIMCEEKECNHNICFYSESNYIALQKIAASYRKKMSTPMIGITGSNGKTTTKELLNHILNKKIKVMSTKGNYNSTLSVPLSIFGLNDKHNISIIEMGASKPGEIETICNFSKPNMGIITNISNSHIKSYRNIEEISETKSKLFDLLPSNGYAFKNIDDPYIIKMKTNAKIITYGFNKQADFSGEYDGKKLKIDGSEIKIPYNNREYAINSIACYAIAKTLNLKSKFICDRIESFTSPLGRKQIIKHNEITIINDTYNANLLSTKSGLTLLENYPGKRKISIIGDMLELGNQDIKDHRNLGLFINERIVDIVIGYGDLIKHTINSITNSKIEKYYFDSMPKLTRFIKNIINDGDVYYIKGSRGMKMESIVKECIS